MTLEFAENLCHKTYMQQRDLWLQVRCPANLKNTLPTASNEAEYSLDNISGHLST